MWKMQCHLSIDRKQNIKNDALYHLKCHQGTSCFNISSYQWFILILMKSWTNSTYIIPIKTLFILWLDCKVNNLWGGFVGVGVGGGGVTLHQGKKDPVETFNFQVIFHMSQLSKVKVQDFELTNPLPYLKSHSVYDAVWYSQYCG